MLTKTRKNEISVNKIAEKNVARLNVRRNADQNKEKTRFWSTFFPEIPRSEEKEAGNVDKFCFFYGFSQHCCFVAASDRTLIAQDKKGAAAPQMISHPSGSGSLPAFFPLHYLAIR